MNTNPFAPAEPLPPLNPVVPPRSPLPPDEPPFTDINSSGVMGLFDPEMSAKIIALVEEVNHRAVVA